MQCDICQGTFDTPAAMVKHRYQHYEYMYECNYCRKGFQFESQLKEHLRVHQAQGDWTCFLTKMREEIQMQVRVEHALNLSQQEGIQM